MQKGHKNVPLLHPNSAMLSFHSDCIVQMRLCCLKGHLLVNLSSYCKCLQDGLSRVRSEPQCLAAILDQINFNLSALDRRPGDLVHLVGDLIE